MHVVCRWLQVLVDGASLASARVSVVLFEELVTLCVVEDEACPTCVTSFVESWKECVRAAATIALARATAQRLRAGATQRRLWCCARGGRGRPLLAPTCVRAGAWWPRRV